MSERWKSYIIKGVETAGGPFSFALERWNFERPVFDAIRRILPNGGRVLEVGCGAGILTALLANHGYGVTGIDNDPDIVDYAREMVVYFRSNATIECASAQDLSPYHGQFDLTFSLGVLEHFDADVTVNMIREQARCAPVVVAEIPTRYTKYTGKITDERIYRRGQFEALIQKAGLRLRESFVHGNVPTRVRLALHAGLPFIVYRGLQHTLTYAMGVCCIGERVAI